MNKSSKKNQDFNEKPHDQHSFNQKTISNHNDSFNSSFRAKSQIDEGYVTFKEAKDDESIDDSDGRDYNDDIEGSDGQVTIQKSASILPINSVKRNSLGKMSLIHERSDSFRNIDENEEFEDDMLDQESGKQTSFQTLIQNNKDKEPFGGNSQSSLDRINMAANDPQMPLTNNRRRKVTLAN